MQNPAVWSVLILIVAGGLLGLDRVLSHRRQSTYGLLINCVTAVAVAGSFVAPCLLFKPAPAQRQLSEMQLEMSGVNDAFLRFRVNFGQHPPSGLHLHENIAGWTADVRSRAHIRRIWPRFDFGLGRDLNRDGDTEDSFDLAGAECLVFFLGGFLKVDADTNRAAVGFSKNPADPFALPDALIKASRDGPFFDFTRSTLTDLDKDGFFELVPRLPDATVPYIYLTDVSHRSFRNEDARVFPGDDKRNLQSCYTTDAEGEVPHNIKSFQLISAGSDDEYGVGGFYDPNKADTLLIGDRAAERDNITNLHSGRLIDQ